MVAPPTDGDRSAARLELPIAGLVCAVPPRSASRILFLRPESPGDLLECVLHSLGHPGRVLFSTLFQEYEEPVYSYSTYPGRR